MKRIIYLLFGLLPFNIFAQELESETGFKFVKADYLIQTLRYEDAINELNDVIKQNPLYKDAILVRAEAKYKLGANAAAKTDVLTYFDLNGATHKAISLLAKIEYNLANFQAALNNLNVVLASNQEDVKLYEMRAQIYQDRNELLKACQDWEKAARMGSDLGKANAKNLCGSGDIATDTKPRRPRKDRNPEPSSDPQNNDPKPSDNESGTGTSPTNQDNNTTTPTETDPNQGTENPVPSDDTTGTENVEEEEVVDENAPPADNTVQKIEIDEDLSIDLFGQGLGKRTILDRPSILILSEQTGTVAIDVCVDQSGRVTTAELNTTMSTINQKSLISLAIRKSKEFSFETGEYPQQCGVMIFRIKGS